MHARECAGAKIPLACPRHPAQITHLAVKDAQRLLTTALCQHVCGRRMACGRHTCLQLCHGEELDHHSLCREMVDDTCKAGHLIRRRCCDAAGEIACRRCAELEAARKRAAEKLRAEREAREREEVERRKKEADVLAEAERARAQRAWEESEMLHRDVIKQKLAALAQSSSSVTKTQLGRSGEWAAEFLKVVDRTEKYVQVAHGTPIVVSRIEKVSNPALEKLFLEAKMRLRSGVADDRCGMMQLFHGTGVEGVKGIPLNGFRLPGKSEDNMFGQGVYFATDSSKSAQSMYTKDSRCLILCDVLLGKTCAVEALKQQHPLSKHVKTSSKKRPYLDVDLAAVQKAGYDSVFAPRGGDRGAGGVLFDEFIVYDPAQAIPRFIVHFGACPALGDAGASWRHPATTLGARVTVRTLTAREVNADNSNSPEVTHYNMAYAQYHRLLGSSAKAVHTVDFYESEAVTRRFQEKKAEFARDKKPIKEIWVFHGTPDIANVAKICSGGLKVGGRDGLGVRNGAVYGAGAYTATGPGTPMGYSSGTRCVILCLGLTGTEGAKEQSDCWVGGGPDVRIFAHGDQLLPRYVVHFEGE
ncbi:hypothetical protein T484DRAFT_1781991 [Baffinella frigidus]|nr:hypothetical protein T484DRAFT_1781991 [Cryptophyta sp. CCMP2293]